MKIKLTKWDIQDYLKTPGDRAQYIEAAMEEAQRDGDLHLLAVALADVAKAMGGGAVSVFLTGVSTGMSATPAPSAARRMMRKGCRISPRPPQTL